MPSDQDAPYSGSFSDGQSAASLDVTVHLEKSGLDIIDKDGSRLALWAWDDLRLAEPASRTRPIRLSNRELPGARLTIYEPAAFAILRTQARYLSREPLNRSRVYVIAGTGAACIAVILFFVFGLPRLGPPVASLIPVSWETPVGESTASLVNQLFAGGRPWCSNEAGMAAVAKLAGKLSASRASLYDVRVDIADSPMVNALALPGGRIILFRGLIEKAGAPDEVAGVLAHEMAHVQKRHPTVGMIHAVGWSALLSAFTGGASLSTEAAARLAAHLATSAYTRDLEAEADANATAMLVTSGIGTEGLARFFRSVQTLEKSGLSLPAYLSTHPQTGDRIAAIEREAGHAHTPALTDAEWKALQAICKRSGE